MKDSKNGHSNVRNAVREEREIKNRDNIRMTLW